MRNSIKVHPQQMRGNEMGNKKVNYIIRRLGAPYTLPNGAMLKDVMVKTCYVCGGRGYYMRKERVMRCIMCGGDRAIRHIYFYTGGKNK